MRLYSVWTRVARARQRSGGRSPTLHSAIPADMETISFGGRLEGGGLSMTLSDVKALTFDVFGTVVDYRGTIIREGERLNQAKGLQVDWAQFADAWRARYRPSMALVMQGELPCTNLDALHPLALDELLSSSQLNDRLTEDEKLHLHHVCQRLHPFPNALHP